MFEATSNAVLGPRIVDPRYILEPFEPAYMALYRSGELEARAASALNELEDCCACPRNCHVNRLEMVDTEQSSGNHTGRKPVCHTGRYARVASVFPHFGEEDCLRGWQGSGTIFFSLCNLRCVFCQNWDISQAPEGRESTADELAEIMLELQERGCHNINFVTPEHVAPQVIEAVAAAVPRGLRLPIVYNTSAYDAIDSLRLLDGIVDIYMPDFKFWNRESARRLAKAKDYPERAREVIAEMHRQVGVLRFGPDGLARRGLLVRHLVMPGQTEEATAVCRWLAEELSPDTYIDLMEQYFPTYQVGERDKGGASRYTDLTRQPDFTELLEVHTAARNAGLWRFDRRWSEAARHLVA